MNKSNYLKVKFGYFTLILLSLMACSEPANDNQIEANVDRFFETYIKHNDLERFMSFYAEGAVLEDIINGDRIEGKENLKAFFDWSNPNLKMTDSVGLVLEELVIKDNIAVGKGYFAPFEYYGITFRSMHFTTILTFSEEGKIIKQVDWINYPSNLVDYNNRKNSNDWIK